MQNLIIKMFCLSSLCLSSYTLATQTPETSKHTNQIPQTSLSSALQASPYSFDFENIEIDRVAQLIESIQPMDIVFAPHINSELPSAILLKDKSLFDILSTALKPHALQIRTLERDLFWIEPLQKTLAPLHFARQQHILPLMPVELCAKKTTLMLKQLNAVHIQHEENGMLEDFGKKDRIRAELNHQQVQIYCMRQFDTVSARIIVIGSQQNRVDQTLQQLIQAYQD